jgi:hypothetical protein
VPLSHHAGIRGRRAIIGMVLAAALGGCGHAGQQRGAGARASATASASPARAATAPHAPKLLYVWRNFEETGVPDELTVYADGALRYRNLLHTQMGIRPRTARLEPGRLRAIRRLLRRVDVAHEDASGVKPRRDGYRWVLRRDGRVGTAADGHLHGALRPLLRRVGVLMDRLQSRSLS